MQQILLQYFAFYGQMNSVVSRWQFDQYLKGYNMKKQKITFWDFIGACIMGAILGALLAWGL